MPKVFFNHEVKFTLFRINVLNEIGCLKNKKYDDFRKLPKAPYNIFGAILKYGCELLLMVLPELSTLQGNRN